MTNQNPLAPDFPGPDPVGTQRALRGDARLVAAWLLGVAVLVFAMVVIGGITRLTHSGLSMVEWDPLFGWIPPMDAAAWQALFDKYRQFPQYLQLNKGMSPREFQEIFWWEYLHRVWGRLIGVAFLLPFLVLLALRRIPAGLTPRLTGLFVLGGLQGLLGWYMVKSGLAARPDVTHYRLAAHLGLAVLIYALLLRTALDLLNPGRLATADLLVEGPRRLAHGLTLLVFIVILAGGLVAGLDAGFIYNSFPLMGGRLIPGDAYDLVPAWLNYFENAAMVQFQHRWLAGATFLGLLAFWQWARYRAPAGPAQMAVHAVLAAGTLQIALGIATLLLVVPIALAALHQAGALLLLTSLIIVGQMLRGQRT